MVDSSVKKKGEEKPPLNSRHTVNVNESNGPQYHKIPFKGKRKKIKKRMHTAGFTVNSMTFYISRNKKQTQHVKLKSSTGFFSKYHCNFYQN